MNIKTKSRNFHLNIESGCIDFLWKIPKEGKDNHGRWLWLKYSNKKNNERIWGRSHIESKYHFCLDIPSVITLDTAYLGKRILNSRVYLTQLFKKDFKVYSSGDSSNG